MSSRDPTPQPPTAVAAVPRGLWEPLRRPVFRSLWIASLFSNLGTWIHGVGAAWLMTNLTTSAGLVALVQVAANLPLFMLSLPAGALADVVDRRRVLLVSQSWMLGAALLLAAVTWLDLVTPMVLLGLIFLLAVGAALNGPAWQAMVPELVEAEDLASAVTLGSISFNLARAAGPALGGLLVAFAGPAATFLLNAGSFVAVLVALVRWRRLVPAATLPAERIVGAMRTGLRYVWYAPAVRAILARGAAFLFAASALWALLPQVVRREIGLGPAGYGALLGCFGLGAVSTALMLPRLRQALRPRRLVAIAALIFAAAMAGLGVARDPRLLAPVMVLAGAAWLSTLATLNVAVQTAVPAWVRARVVAVYMVVFFGSLALGSTVWGGVAERLSSRAALLAAALLLVLMWALTGRLALATGNALDLAPSRHWPAPTVALDDDGESPLALGRGPVLVTVDYRIDPADEGAFRAAMDEVRRTRLRDGALQWGLFTDAADPSRLLEVFLVESWLEHLRQHERATFADQAIERRAESFHRGDGAPRVDHWLGSSRA